MDVSILRCDPRILSWRELQTTTKCKDEDSQDWDVMNGTGVETTGRVVVANVCETNKAKEKIMTMLDR